MRFYLLAWLPMVVLAIINGTLRDLWYGSHMRTLTAHQVSTLTLIALLSVYIWFVIRHWPPRSRRQAWSVGLVWLTLTVGFELGFGHYVAGHPWSDLVADYDLASGRLWVLIPAWTALAPYLLYRLRR